MLAMLTGCQEQSDVVEQPERPAQTHDEKADDMQAAKRAVMMAGMRRDDLIHAMRGIALERQAVRRAERQLEQAVTAGEVETAKRLLAKREAALGKHEAAWNAAMSGYRAVYPEQAEAWDDWRAQVIQKTIKVGSILRVRGAGDPQMESLMAELDEALTAHPGEIEDWREQEAVARLTGQLD